MMTKTLVLAMAMTTAGLAGGARGAETDPLSGYRWKSRVLVIAAPSAGDDRLAAQRRAFSAAVAGMAERDLVVVEAVGADAAANSLRRRLDLPADGFRAVLVGKDGEAKITQAEPISTETVFSTIDAMPMRRDEQRRR